jgi:hypothetical protein
VRILSDVLSQFVSPVVQSTNRSPTESFQYTGYRPPGQNP